MIPLQKKIIKLNGKNNISTDDLLATIIKGIEDVKGLDIDILDLREIDNRFVIIS